MLSYRDWQRGGKRKLLACCVACFATIPHAQSTLTDFDGLVDAARREHRVIGGGGNREDGQLVTVKSQEEVKAVRKEDADRIEA